ncbi:MAG: hypothetical protein LBU37_11430 [Tannerellaceae bacterium]|jgi:hypothetical protein|nr:hypothetical protein [Tannerellaceae bacterium]
MKQKKTKQKCYGAILSKMMGLFLIGAGLSSGVHAQVTIGSGETPAKGALLDMKEFNGNNETSKKGVLFPRVKLKDLNSLSPLVETADATEKSIHKGIVVYNITVKDPLKEGLYYWDGNAWVYVYTQNDTKAWGITGNAGTDTVRNYIGTSDGNALSIRTNAKERMLIDANGYVGIGTNKPTKMLEINGPAQINGKTYLKTADPAPPSDGVSQLVRNNATGEVLSLVTGKNSKALNYIYYVIECSSKETGHSDWIDDFDTKIGDDQFMLAVVGSSFKTNTTGSGLSTNGSGSGTFAPSVVQAIPKNGTWHLQADYTGAAPADGKPGTWTIHCLAINLSIIKKVDITNGNYTGDGSKFKMRDKTDSAPAAPSGLFE